VLGTCEVDGGIEGKFEIDGLSVIVGMLVGDSDGTIDEVGVNVIEGEGVFDLLGLGDADGTLEYLFVGVAVVVGFDVVDGTNDGKVDADGCKLLEGTALVCMVGDNVSVGESDIVGVIDGWIDILG